MFSLNALLVCIIRPFYYISIIVKLHGEIVVKQKCIIYYFNIKIAVRVCIHAFFFEHGDLSLSLSLFYNLNVLEIYDINKFQTTIFMFKYVNNDRVSTFNNFFTCNRNIFSYPTQCCHRKVSVSVPKSKRLLAQNFLRHHGLDIWNNIPICVKQRVFYILLKNS